MQLLAVFCYVATRSWQKQLIAPFFRFNSLRPDFHQIHAFVTCLHILLLLSPPLYALRLFLDLYHLPGKWFFHLVQIIA